MELKLMNIGRCDYRKALELQYNIIDDRQRGQTGDTLILVEHPPVITIGRNGKESNIIVSQEYLNNMGISVHETDRGGDVTYHGYGQIVGYPIISLKEKHIGIREFVRNLEDVFIELLRDQYGIKAERDEKHTGVWVGNNKIAAIGLAVKRGVTMHGFAFNVNTNLEHFKLIVPCGISDKGVTSIEQLTGEKADFESTNEMVAQYFSRVFK